jgi:hypothetical protein
MDESSAVLDFAGLRTDADPTALRNETWDFNRLVIEKASGAHGPWR